MELFRSRFASLKESLQSTIQLLSATAAFSLLTYVGFLCLIFLVYLLFTKFWWFVILYTFWMYVDRNACETGGRPNEWIQNLSLWVHTKEYFPTRLKLVPNFQLDPKRNYLFACFPHGVVPFGPFCNIAVPSSDLRRLYPHFHVRSTILAFLFNLPFTRDLALACGAISSSSQAISNILSKPEGGYIVTLMPGGAQESLYSLPKQYKFVVKNRKGFVKMALKCGTPLVPVLTFGETDLFDQIRGSTVRKIQIFTKKYLGFVPLVPIGRFGIVPKKKTLTTVVGTPINVNKIQNPTDDQVEELHQTFIKELKSLFETYKYRYIENPERVNLELV